MCIFGGVFTHILKNEQIFNVNIWHFERNGVTSRRTVTKSGRHLRLRPSFCHYTRGESSTYPWRRVGGWCPYAPASGAPRWPRAGSTPWAGWGAADRCPRRRSHPPSVVDDPVTPSQPLILVVLQEEVAPAPDVYRRPVNSWMSASGALCSDRPPP